MKKYILFLASFALSLMIFSSCSEEVITTYINDDEEEDTRPLVYYLQGEGKMGDQTYSDAIYRGVLGSAYDKDFDMLVSLVTLPNDTTKLVSTVRSFLANIKDVGSNRKTLVVINNDGYESMLHQYEDTISKIENVDFLLIESRDTLLPMHSIHFPLYGACYLAGCVVGEAMTDVDKALVVNANRSNTDLEDMRKGFAQGIADTGGRVEVDNFFIADKSGGFDMADSAYRYSYAIDTLYQMVLPLCGGTAQGFLRYNREKPNSFYTIGIDGDMSIYSKRVPFSIVKRLELATQDWISRWAFGEEMPKHITYDLSSYMAWINITDDYEAKLSPTANKYLQQAIAKEEEYEKNK